MRKLHLVILSLALVGVLAGLWLPTHTASAQSLPGCARVHVVQPGQNLFRIGLLYGVRWDVLAAWNGLVNPNLVRVGQVLCVSGPVTPAPLPPPAPPPGPITVYPGNPFGPTTEPRIFFPSVTLGVKFELRGYNFPPNRQITISLTTLGNPPYVPYYTATTDATGQFYVLVNIPSPLTTAATVAVDARTASGFFGRNWFYNR